jgi:hypothetical protein
MMWGQRTDRKLTIARNGVNTAMFAGSSSDAVLRSSVYRVRRLLRWLGRRCQVSSGLIKLRPSLVNIHRSRGLHVFRVRYSAEVG